MRGKEKKTELRTEKKEKKIKGKKSGKEKWGWGRKGNPESSTSPRIKRNFEF